MSRAKTLFSFLFILCGSMVITIPAAAEDAVKRVRVDLDFEQLGIVTDGQPAGSIELAIHCANCATVRPLHHVSMEGDALVVMVEPIAGSSKGSLDLAVVAGIDISVEDGVEVVTVDAPAQEKAPETVAEPELAPIAIDPTPVTVEPAPVTLEPAQIAVEPVPIAPETLPEPDSIEAPPSAESIPEVIQREVLDVMEAAMAEARAESAARSETAQQPETSEDAQPGSGSWVVERNGEVVGQQ